MPARGNVNGMLANLDTLCGKQLALIADTINYGKQKLSKGAQT